MSMFFILGAATLLIAPFEALQGRRGKENSKRRSYRQRREIIPYRRKKAPKLYQSIGARTLRMF